MNLNVIDYVVIGIVGVSVLFGLFRGFISSVLNMGGGLISFGLSFWLSPKLASFVQTNDGLVQTIRNYTDTSKLLGDLNLALTNVAQLGQQGIQNVLSKLTLPPPLDSLLQFNMENQVYAAGGAVNVQDYVDQTIVQACINILSFVICFIVLYLLLSILINVIKAVFRLPLLKQLDGLAGGAFGFLRGLLICLVIFTLLPLVMTVVPLEPVAELIEQSALAPVFSNGNLIRAIMNGGL